MSSRDVVVVGAGVAGLAATAALADAGARVTLLERRPFVGGRAYSYEHPATGEVIDSQHVLLGCCTNLVDLCERAGIAGQIKWYDEIPFLEPGGRRSVIRPAGLPSPAHAMPSFMGAAMLGLDDKAAIAMGLMRFLAGIPADDHESFDEWVRRTGQTERAIRHFWEPILISTLNDTLERCSTKYAAMVLRESLMKSAAGGRFGIPMEPLSEFYGAVARLAEAKGATVRLKCGVDGLRQDGTEWVVSAGGEEIRAEAVVLAASFEQVPRLLAGLPDDARKAELLWHTERFVHAPITTIHLWYDREVTEMDHAALLDSRIQWMFNKSRIRGMKTEGCYLELCISASHPELEMEREAILREALREMDRFFPAVREATLLKSAVLKEARATFSVLPGMDAFRPEARTAWPGLYLAGDWTRTGWPSTMESGVRSGRLAAEAITGTLMLAPELAASGLMRIFG